MNDGYIKQLQHQGGKVDRRYKIALAGMSAPSANEGTVFHLSSQQLQGSGTAMDTENKQIAVERGNMRWRSIIEQLGTCSTNLLECYFATGATITHTNGVATALDITAEFNGEPKFWDGSAYLTDTAAVKRAVATAMATARTSNRLTYANITARTGKGHQHKVESVTAAAVDTITNIEAGGGNANIAVTVIS
mgnify:FL=1